MKYRRILECLVSCQGKVLHLSYLLAARGQGCLAPHLTGGLLEMGCLVVLLAGHQLLEADCWELCCGSLALLLINVEPAAHGRLACCERPAGLLTRGCMHALGY